MGKLSGSFLLSHGDILKLAPDIYLLFQCGDRIEGEGFDMLQTVEMKVSPLAEAFRSRDTCFC